MIKELVKKYNLENLSGYALLSAADSAIEDIADYYTTDREEYWWIREILEGYRQTAKEQIRKPIIEAAARKDKNNKSYAPIEYCRF
jgi:hypothetical protein